MIAAKNKIITRAIIEVGITLSPILPLLYFLNYSNESTSFSILDQLYFLFTGIIGVPRFIYPKSIVVGIIMFIIALGIRILIIGTTILFVKNGNKKLAIFLSIVNFAISYLIPLTGISVLTVSV